MKRNTSALRAHVGLFFLQVVVIGLAGCQTAVRDADRQVATIVAERQAETLGIRSSADVGSAPLERFEPNEEAYDERPSPLERDVPELFSRTSNNRATTGMMERISAGDEAGGAGDDETGVEDPVGEAPEGEGSQGDVDFGGELDDAPELEAAIELQDTVRLGDESETADVSPATTSDASATSDDASAATQPGATQPANALDARDGYIDLPSGERWVTRYRDEVFTLTDALAYAQRHQRAYQSAKEDLYLAALSLTLERHLWTPQFAAEIRQVYGNFGEIRDFDNATRFVADLSVSQRLPYGGEFTARVLSRLIRDLGRSITAEESGQIELGVRVPLLRGAGMVAREDLIQLERDLTYAVRTFERFRRGQLVDVADRYFNLLRSKQAVLDAITSLNNAIADFDRAKASEDLQLASPLDTGRATSRMLSEANRLANLRESFRATTDQFKILIGMPVSTPLGIDDLETIDDIRAQIVNGTYPLLRRVEAVDDEAFAVEVALRSRLDLVNTRDRIADAKRGVSIAKNALLPTLDWSGTVTWDSDPTRFEMGGFEWERTTWRTDIVLAMNDRFAERNQLRRSVISVNRARRSYVDAAERLRADVLRALNEVRLQEQVLEIQEQILEVADRQREFAQIRFEDGDIDNRDKIEAEDDYVDALNQLNAARTDRWSALLEFRLATGTIRIDEYGAQHTTPVIDPPAPEGVDG